ncbi:septal ring factor EnvC (AmiA/AmiB activator) [Elusimicrobium simillimum]|uniref:murein hydrolase activator EnvC family protein n=1 Tax=Elusimicrobium simillimum TaxID=3143438 RepID=UPI003C6FDFAA
MEKILTFILLLALFTPAWADPSQSDLSALEIKAKEKEEELKKYQEEEKKLNRELSTLEKRQVQTQQLINKIEYDMNIVERSKITAANKKEALERSQPVWENSLEKEAEIFITQLLADWNYFDSDDIATNVLINRALEKKSAFTSELKKENKIAQDKIESFEERNRRLQQENEKVAQQRSLLTKDFQKVKVDLNVNKKKYDAAKKELEELNKSAEEMKNLLSAAEEKRKKAATKEAKAKGDTQTPVVKAEIDVKRNTLPHPVSGEVFSKFGKEYNKNLNTWIFRDGVKIGARKGETVYTVAEGTVIYAGAFRSYGNVIIVDHGKGFFTIYGYLNRIDVDKGDTLGSRSPIGVVGVDNYQGSMGTGRTALYFEVRQGATAVDPELWLE